MSFPMPPAIRKRFEKCSSAPLTWRQDQEVRPARFFWVESQHEDLGPDPDGKRFREISKRMLSGRYYPPDALEFFGIWMDENREIRVGDRVLQRARLIPFLPRPALWAMTEVFIADRTDTTCTIGYLTTARHFGRGIWKATLTLDAGRLMLALDSQSGPQSWLFWLGLPVARFLQHRAWRRAFEEFRKVR
ncbi:MAG: DUF1990 family protein [Fimbriimonadales bacterium]